MKLNYDDLLKDFNELKECVSFLFGNLEKNGIKVLFKNLEVETCSLVECGAENKVKFEKPSEIIFDFSEHDKKVTEEKDKRIAKLEKETSELRKEAIQKNQRIIELIGELAKEKANKADCGSKINFNDAIKVKLTPHGADIYYHRYDELNKKAEKVVIEPKLPKIDEDGYTRFSLWDFISLYGEHVGLGKKNVIEPIDIVIL